MAQAAFMLECGSDRIFDTKFEGDTQQKCNDRRRPVDPEKDHVLTTRPFMRE